MTAARGRPRGGLEQDVLTCLAAADRPLSPAEVLAELGDNLAYTTVMTTLSRLHAKGVLHRQPRGRGFVYELPVALADVPASVSAHRMRRILDGGGDRAGILARFVSDLSPEDEQVLLRLLSDDKPTSES
ncbi:MAG TPA: BlaI/MecI/CopY family transcriptional regulator [Nocardioidaceae bacterium]|jgi:predicted transcriptional regulator